MNFEEFFNDSLNKYIPFHKKLSEYELELIDIMFAAGAAEALNYVRKDNDKFLEMA